jgi:hypothetical protein
VTEIWLPLNQNPDYEVSNTGKVRSIDRIKPLLSRWGMMTTRKHKGREIKPYLVGSGYLAVNFQMRGKKYYVHRLVAEHFIDGDSSLEVNHKDGDKENNCVNNLEWVTRKENSIHLTHVLGCKKGQFMLGGGRHT